MKTLLFLLLPLFASAQEFKISRSVDDFTGKEMINSNLFLFTVIPEKEVVQLGMAYTEGMYLLYFSTLRKDATLYMEGDELLIKMVDGNIVKTEAVWVSDADFTNDGYMNSMSCFSLSDTDMTNLYVSKISKIRLITNNHSFDYSPGNTAIVDICQDNFREFFKETHRAK